MILMLDLFDEHVSRYRNNEVLFGDLMTLAYHSTLLTNKYATELKRAFARVIDPRGGVVKER